MYDEFAEFRSSIEAKINEHAEEAVNHFSEGEKEAISEKLNKLLHAYEELNKKNKLKDKELDEIKAEVASIKETLETFPKGLWTRTAGNKILKVISTYVTSKEGRQLVIGAAKNLLIGNNSSNQ